MMTSATHFAAHRRNDKALLAMPFLAAGLWFVGRLLCVSFIETNIPASPATLAYWLLLESASFVVFWLPLGWSLAWLCWRIGLHRAPQGLQALALALATAAFLALAMASGSLALGGVSRESLALVLGLFLNLAAYLLVQSEA